MLDLGTLQAHIKLDGADEFNSGLTDAADNADAANEGFTVMKAVLADLAATAIKKAIEGLARLGRAMIDVVHQSIDAYADMEQLEGGIEKLFGDDAAKKVKDNAAEAFRSIGISANDYMSTVTTFSASLISSLGGDTEKAAQAANDALTDMADNASVFGSDMESIQNAYQGFAKQQYTMLDNLKLGYGGTKQEMERLLEDAGKLTGQKYDINNLNDVYSAIHAIQVEQGIAGNAAKEASETVSGSLSSLKASWENLLAGVGDPSKDVDKLVDDVMASLSNVVDKLSPLVDRILQGMDKILPQVAQKIQPLIAKLEPYVSSALQTLGSLALNALGNVLKPLWDQFGHLVITGVALGIGLIVAPVGTLIAATVALLLNQALVFLEDNWGSISKWLGGIPSKISNAVGSLAGTLKAKGSELLGGLRDGAVAKWTDARKWFANLTSNVKSAVGSTIATLRQKGTDLLSGLQSGLTAKWNSIRSWIASIPSKIKSALGNVGSLLFSAGSSIVQGLVNGLSSRVSSVISKAKELGRVIKAHKGPKSYDLKLLVENGQWIMSGLIDGIDSYVPTLQDHLKGVAGTIAGTSLTAPALSMAGAGTAGMTTSTSTNYNVYINGTEINSDSAIEGKFVELMTAMARKGMM